MSPSTKPRIATNITETIGRTPLVKMAADRMLDASKHQATVLLKLEFFNPGGSIKDRIALSMIQEAEQAGFINADTMLVEPTSGNTGIGLAFVAAAKGYKLTLTMPDSMSIERRKLLKAYGAELILTPGALGMKGAIAKAEEICHNTANSYMLQQFSNPANPKIHRNTTAEEIWEDTAGEVDIVVAGVGTGGTVSGLGQALKKRKPEIKVYAVEPKESPVLNGGSPGPHKIQGIGAGFIPENFDAKVVDKIFTIDSETSIRRARELGTQEGILCGISSGTVLEAAMQLAEDPANKNKIIVAIIPSNGERYLSSALYADLDV